MNHVTSETFDENAKAALADSQLRGALRNATSLFGQRRLAAANSLTNWEDLRTQARGIKDDVLLHLDQYLEKFVGNAERRGAKFHWARDAAEANSIICALAKARDARTIVTAVEEASQAHSKHAVTARVAASMAAVTALTVRVRV